MLFSQLVREVSLTKAQQLGLLDLRDRAWKCAIAKAAEDFNTRKMKKEIRLKCVTMVHALATREAAKEADLRLRFKGEETNLLSIFKVLVVNGMARRMSDALSAKLAFLPGHNKRTLWTTTAAQEAGHTMAAVFRQLYLCPCPWMHSLPVVVVAAVLEAFARYPEANNASWWLERKKCRSVWQRAILLCGSKPDAEVTKRVRGAFLMLVMVLRSASKFPDGEVINSINYPVKNSASQAEGNPRNGRLYMSEREVRSLIVALKQGGMVDAADKLNSALQFQNAVARSAAGLENKEITQWCSYSVEEKQTIVTCASDLVLQVSQVLKTLARMAGELKQQDQYVDLMRKLSAGEDFAYPFLLAMVLHDGALCVENDISVFAIAESITERISDDGDIAHVRTGPKSGTSRKRKRYVSIEDEVNEPNGKKQARSKRSKQEERTPLKNNMSREQGGRDVTQRESEQDGHDPNQLRNAEHSGARNERQKQDPKQLLEEKTPGKKNTEMKGEGQNPMRARNEQEEQDSQHLENEQDRHDPKRQHVKQLENKWVEQERTRLQDERTEKGQKQKKRKQKRRKAKDDAKGNGLSQPVEKEQGHSKKQPQNTLS